jgi:hypothetical protein
MLVLFGWVRLLEGTCGSRMLGLQVQLLDGLP